MTTPDETLDLSKGSPDLREGMVEASIRNLKKVWWAVRGGDSLSPDDDDVSAAHTALYCSHFLSTWGQVTFSARS